jgi:RHS repeat-associated protein
VQVFWGAEGASFDEILSTASATELTTSRAAYFRLSNNSEHGFDNVQLIAGTRSTTEAFTYNDANEQLTHAKNGVTTTMTYDDWGRLEERDDGTHTANYGYRYEDKLCSVTSDFPNEGNVTYEYGANKKRRSRVSGSDEKWYNWGFGWSVVSEEDHSDGVSGSLSRTYQSMGRAFVNGDNPVSGNWKYIGRDRRKSNRSSWNPNKTKSSTVEYSPYGDLILFEGAVTEVDTRYSGYDFDQVSGFSFTPYRYYSADKAGWISRDPWGMTDGPNMYAFVRQDPIGKVDSLGGKVDTPKWGGHL